MAPGGRFVDRVGGYGLLRKALCAAATLTFLTVAGAAARCDAATTLRVNKKCNGTGNCYPTIQQALTNASTGTIIVVDPGRYTASCGGPACSVASIVGPSLDDLTLACRPNAGRSVILDATHLDHAIYISGVKGVKVQGCVAENAGREGILVEDSDNVTLKRNEVRDNDKSLSQTAPCPTFLPPGSCVNPPSCTETVPVCCPDANAGGLPGNFPEDNDDCGEGIHLRSVTSSVVESNFIHDNVGGVLLTDETGVNESNLVAGNLSRHNTLDCGITLASHTECTSGSTDATGCTPSVNAGYGVIHNSVVGNASIGNGAAGVGAFANPGSPVDGGAATNASGNLISDNVLKNNGQPGVAIHVHAANGHADNNTVVENIVSGNGGDSEAVSGSPTPGIGIEVLSNGSFGAPFGPASPISGTTISQNAVSNEDIDVWVGNTATDANVVVNDLKGAGKTGVQNGGAGTITATDNWWGCPKGPGSGSCSSAVAGSGTIISSPFLKHPISPED